MEKEKYFSFTPEPLAETLPCNMTDKQERNKCIHMRTSHTHGTDPAPDGPSHHLKYHQGRCWAGGRLWGEPSAARKTGLEVSAIPTDTILLWFGAIVFQVQRGRPTVEISFTNVPHKGTPTLFSELLLPLLFLKIPSGIFWAGIFCYPSESSSI